MKYLLCKKTLEFPIEGDIFLEGKKYTILIHDNLHHVYDEKGNKHFIETMKRGSRMFAIHFYTEQELRKIKIEKLLQEKGDS